MSATCPTCGQTRLVPSPLAGLPVATKLAEVAEAAGIAIYNLDLKLDVDSVIWLVVYCGGGLGERLGLPFAPDGRKASRRYRGEWFGVDVTVIEVLP